MKQEYTHGPRYRGGKGAVHPTLFLQSHVMGGYSALKTLSCFWSLQRGPDTRWFGALGGFEATTRIHQKI